MTLKSKTALITGSTSGIGLDIAQGLAEEGANIIINGLGDRVSIERECMKIEKDFHVKVIYSDADMCNSDQIHEMVSAAEREFGAVDILVNNAGIQHVEPIETFPEEKWDQIIAINLSSNFHTIKACCVGMKRKKWGRIINISSVHGIIASPYKAAYVAAKHGVIGLTKVAALDLSSYGVTANAICPGYVDTPLVRRQIPDQAKQHHISEEDVIQKILLKDHVIKDFVKTRDITKLTLFLCSSEANMITGQSICIDGGWTAH